MEAPSEQPKGNGRGEESKEKRKNQAKNMTLKLQNNQTIRKTARGKKSKDVHRLEIHKSSLAALGNLQRDIETRRRSSMAGIMSPTAGGGKQVRFIELEKVDENAELNVSDKAAVPQVLDLSDFLSSDASVGAVNAAGKGGNKGMWLYSNIPAASITFAASLSAILCPICGLADGLGTRELGLRTAALVVILFEAFGKDAAAEESKEFVMEAAKPLKCRTEITVKNLQRGISIPICQRMVAFARWRLEQQRKGVPLLSTEYANTLFGIKSFASPSDFKKYLKMQNKQVIHFQKMLKKQMESLSGAESEAAAELSRNRGEAGSCLGRFFCFTPKAVSKPPPPVSKSSSSKQLGGIEIEMVDNPVTREGVTEEEIAVVDESAPKDDSVWQSSDFPAGPGGYFVDGMHTHYILLMKVLLQLVSPFMVCPDTGSVDVKELSRLSTTAGVSTGQKMQHSVTGLSPEMVSILAECAIQWNLSNVFCQSVYLAILCQQFEGAVKQNCEVWCRKDTKLLNYIKRLVVPAFKRLLELIESEGVDNISLGFVLQSASFVQQAFKEVMKDYKKYFPENKPEGSLDALLVVGRLSFEVTHKLAGSTNWDLKFGKLVNEIISESYEEVYQKLRRKCRESQYSTASIAPRELKLLTGGKGEGSYDVYEAIFGEGEIGLIFKQDKEHGSTVTVGGFKDLKTEGGHVGLAEDCGYISIGDIPLAMGITFADQSITALSADQLMDKLQHHQRPLTISFLSSTKNASTRKVDLPLKADQLVLLAASLQREMKTIQTFFEGTFSSITPLLTRDVVSTGLMIYYTNLATDLQPYLGESSVSLLSLDPAIFPLYFQLKGLHDIIKHVKNITLGLIDIEYFFGRHVPTWIEVSYQKIATEMIPNNLSMDDFTPIDEDNRHSNSCVTLFWICIQNANVYKTLPGFSTEGHIGQFAFRLLAGPLRFYTDSVLSKITSMIKEGIKAEEKGFFSSMFGKKSAFEQSSLEITIELCVLLNNLFHCQKQLFVVLAVLNDFGKVKGDMTEKDKDEKIDVTQYSDVADAHLQNAMIADETSEPHTLVDDICGYQLDFTIKTASGFPKSGPRSPIAGNLVGGVEYFCVAKVANSFKEFKEGIFKTLTTGALDSASTLEFNHQATKDWGELISDEAEILIEIFEREKMKRRVESVGEVSISLRRYVDGGMSDLEFEVKPPRGKKAVPGVSRKMRVQFQFTSIQIGQQTIQHLKRSLYTSVDMLVDNLFTSGVVVPLTDYIFSNPLKDIRASSISQDDVEDRMMNLLDYLTDQFTVLHSVLYSDVFIGLFMNRIWTKIVTHLVSMLVVHSPLNPKSVQRNKWCKYRYIPEIGKLIGEGGSLCTKMDRKAEQLCGAQVMLAMLGLMKLQNFLHCDGAGLSRKKSDKMGKGCRDILTLLSGSVEELKELRAEVAKAVGKSKGEAPPEAAKSPSSSDNGYIDGATASLLIDGTFQLTVGHVDDAIRRVGSK